MKITELSPKQMRIMTFLASPDRYLICDGAVRSGKTVCMVTAFVVWAMSAYTETNFAICGKTVTNAERNVLSPLLSVEGLPYKMRYNRGERKLIVRCGKRTNYFYLYGGKDESSYQLIQGITLAGILLDEVALMPRSFVEQAMARTLTYSGAKIWFNCNPGNQMHWFNQEWIIPIDRGEKAGKHLHFLMTDNPIMREEEIEQAKDMFSGVFYDRYILGLWCSADGLIFDMFNRERHTAQELPETEGEYFVSSDFGIQNANTFLLWRKEKASDRWVCLKEYYYSGREERRQKTVGELVDDLQAMLGGIQPLRVIVDPSAAALIAELRKRGYKTQGANNDVLEGITDVGTMLKADRLLFSTECKHTIREFGEYVWDEKAALHGEDRPVKEHDHCMDAVRYFVKTKRLAKVQQHRTDLFYL